MWIARTSDWHESHTDLSKYFIEKLKQQVDPTEIISNKHRTTNGLTLVDEIITIAGITKSRPKFKNRLFSVLSESKSKFLATNIVNDYILNNYFKDITKFYLEFELSKNGALEKELNLLITKSRIFFKRLSDYYYGYLLAELDYIDFNSSHFDKEARKIDKIIECLVPYLLFLGYSSTSISEIAYRYIFKNQGTKAPGKIVKHFSGRISEFKFLIRTIKNSKELEFIQTNLDKEQIVIKSISLDEAKTNFHENNLLELEENSELCELTFKTTDPHYFLRSLYDQGLKRYVASCDRLTLNYFTHFFDNVYWRFSKSSKEAKYYYQNSKSNLDPINVPERGSTLRHTLSKLRRDYRFKYDDNKGIPFLDELSEVIYFYNLALGSKSIENSLSLLWTSLEMLVPYRVKDYDIQNVQYFVSKSLSVGSISRELVSFVSRFVGTNKLNNNVLDGVKENAKYVSYSIPEICDWAIWLGKEYSETDSNDPFHKLKDSSNLLCKQYCHLNSIFTGRDRDKNTVSYWLHKIKASEEAINYQLDRIYLHRNQVVHSGKFINEYSNLWSHLEWYVGKLLAFAVIQCLVNEGQDLSLEDIFMGLEADNDQLIMLLEANSDDKINNISDMYELVFKHSWQSF